jgi:hypothetical protein
LPYTHKPSLYRENWPNLFLGIAAPIVLWGTVVWAAIAYGSTPGTQVTANQLAAAPVTLQQAGEQDFVSAWARLDSALAHRGKQNAQTVLQRVHDKSAALGTSVCNFEWKQGQVSLVYGPHTGSPDPGGQTAGQPMGRDMSNCADAVEKEESSQ